PDGNLGALGWCCRVWDVPGVGVRLMVGQEGGGNDEPLATHEVYMVDFDPGTEAVTRTSIDWRTEVGETATALNMFPWDDGNGEQLYICGHFLDTGTTYKFPNI